MLQREAVDGLELILDVLRVAGLIGDLFQPLRDMVDDGKGILAAMDHVENLHLDLLLPAMRLEHGRFVVSGCVIFRQ